jgi:TATA-binding protein-associated factor Taf7
MPKASSSRQRKFEPSSDIDEEDSFQHDPHDGMDVDDIDDEDEGRKPLRTSRSGKERKPNIKKGKAKATGGDDEVDAEDAEDEGSRIDVANFRDQPLDKSDANRLNGLCKDWESMRKGLSEASFQMLNDIGRMLAEVDADGKVRKEICWITTNLDFMIRLRLN